MALSFWWCSKTSRAAFVSMHLTSKRFRSQIAAQVLRISTTTSKQQIVHRCTATTRDRLTHACSMRLNDSMLASMRSRSSRDQRRLPDTLAMFLCSGTWPVAARSWHDIGDVKYIIRCRSITLATNVICNQQYNGNGKSSNMLVTWSSFAFTAFNETYRWRAYLHGLVVDDLAVEDVSIHALHHFRVVVIEILFDERALEQRAVDVDQLITINTSVHVQCKRVLNKYAYKCKRAYGKIYVVRLH